MKLLTDTWILRAIGKSPKWTSLQSNLLKRFWAKVQKTSTCWVWTGGKLPTGYGITSILGCSALAHRVAFVVHHRRSIDTSKVLDHVCRNSSCVNPAHLEEVSQKENIRRGDLGLNSANRNKTHCKKGHRYSSENTHITVNGWRQCKPCRVARDKRRRSTIIVVEPYR